MNLACRVRGAFGACGACCARSALIFSAFAAGACDRPLPTTWQTEAPPGLNTAAGFANLWSENCAGCHGADGVSGPSRPLRDAHFLATVSDAQFTAVIAGGSPPGTMMPGFGRAAGGALTDDEIAAIISGMRREWGNQGARASSIPYAAPLSSASTAGSSGGDATRGERAFQTFCAACHGESASSVTDPFFLRLVSNQMLRSSMIFGRPDLGMPGADGPFPGLDPAATLSAQDVDDITAWLVQRRDQDWPPKSIRRGGSP